MSKRKLGQLYIDYTPNPISIKPKYVDTVDEEDEKPAQPGLPDDGSTDVPPPPEDEDSPGDGGVPSDGDGGSGGSDDPLNPDDPLKPPDDDTIPPDDPNIPPEVPDVPTEPHDVVEKRYHESLKQGDEKAAKIALVTMWRQWHKEYAKDFRVGAHELLIGHPEVMVAEPILMHEHAKLVSGAYENYYNGPEAADRYLKHPKHSYIDDFHKWEIHKELSTRDNLVLVKTAEDGTQRVVIAYRGTNPSKLADWNTNVQMLMNNEEGTQRILDADNQMMKILGKFNKDQITVAGHSQGGGVSAYIAEKYNVPGHHYQPALFGEARQRILGVDVMTDLKNTIKGRKFKLPQRPRVPPLRPTGESEAAIELKKMTDESGMADVNLEDRPLLEGYERGPAYEKVPLKDVERSIYGKRNTKWINDAQLKHDIRFAEQRAQQQIYRTIGDPVSAVSLSGLGRNKNWKINHIASTLENHDNLGSIHSHSNFDPPPVDLAEGGAAAERSALLGAEHSAGTVLVNRASRLTAVKGAIKGVGMAAGAGLTVYDTYNNFTKFINDPNMSKGDKATLGSLEIAKQGAAFFAGDALGTAAGGAAGAMLVGMAPAIVASGGALLVGMAVGVGVGIGVSMLGDYAKKHYKDVKHAGETVGSIFKGVGDLFGGKKTKVIDADPEKVARYRELAAKGDKVGAMKLAFRGLQKDKPSKKQVDPAVARANRRQAMRSIRKVYKKSGF